MSLSRGTKEEAFSILPAGTVLPFAGAVAPSGWALCDGSTVSRADNPELYLAVGDAWGNGDGSTTFHLPDLRGRMLRGTDNAAGRDPDAGARTAANTGGNTGDAVGTVQSDAIRNMTGAWSVTNTFTGDPSASGVYSTSGTSTLRPSPGTGTNLRNTINFNAGNQVPTAAENRPVNANMNYIIKL